jgi:hypothetical protein
MFFIGKDSLQLYSNPIQIEVTSLAHLNTDRSLKRSFAERWTSARTQNKVSQAIHHGLAVFSTNALTSGREFMKSLVRGMDLKSLGSIDLQRGED